MVPRQMAPEQIVVVVVVEEQTKGQVLSLGIYSVLDCHLNPLCRAVAIGIETILFQADEEYKIITKMHWLDVAPFSFLCLISLLLFLTLLSLPGVSIPTAYANVTVFESSMKYHGLHEPVLDSFSWVLSVPPLNSHSVLSSSPSSIYQFLPFTVLNYLCMSYFSF